MPESFILAMQGGVLIGISALVMMFFLGRITGISEFIWQAFNFNGNVHETSWRWSFLLGLIIGAYIAVYVLGFKAPENELVWWKAAVSGLLVGFGTKMGSGCTSGHGICGIGRLAPRSIIATCTFMASGIVTVFVLGGI